MYLFQIWSDCVLIIVSIPITAEILGTQDVTPSYVQRMDHFETCS